MFRVENNVPDVYVQESRDFQLFCKLYDLAFQGSRFSIDSMEEISDTMRCNSALLPLLATKIGFFSDHIVADDTYRKVLSAFPYIIRYKGSMKGVQLVANLFEHIMNREVKLSTGFDNNDITIVFDKETPDIDLFNTLIEYVRPAGSLIDLAILVEVEGRQSDVAVNDKVSIRKQNVTAEGCVNTGNVSFTQVYNKQGVQQDAE